MGHQEPIKVRRVARTDDVQRHAEAGRRRVGGILAVLLLNLEEGRNILCNFSRAPSAIRIVLPTISLASHMPARRRTMADLLAWFFVANFVAKPVEFLGSPWNPLEYMDSENYLLNSIAVSFVNSGSAALGAVA